MLLNYHLIPMRLQELITKIVSLFLEVEDLTQVMGPFDRITRLISSINIHLMQPIHAAKDHIEKTESVKYVLEVPIKPIRVIIHVPNVLLEQQIR